VDPAVVKIVEERDLALGQAVKLGVMAKPPHGEPSAESIIEALKDLDAELFVIVEQDLYPCDFDVPLPIAIQTNEYLRQCGLGPAPRRA
jgi:inosose dehydratase